MRIEEIINQSIIELKKKFDVVDEVAQYNTEKVLKAFQENKIEQRHFYASNGYGYDDLARDTLEKLFSSIMSTESAIFRPQIVSGTHALSLCLFGLLRPGDHYISASGLPYDTLQTVMGLSRNVPGNLSELNIEYSQVDLIDNQRLDITNICNAIKSNTKLIMVQRSRGYSNRKALSTEKIGELTKKIHNINPNIIVMVDNCYGEFVEKTEPTNYGVDIMAGSLIKNAGGGIAPTGGYICGKEKYINLISTRLTTPGLGRELGSYENTYRPFYQGLFLAPHIVSQALKVAILYAKVFEKLGFNVFPSASDARSDIVQTIHFGDKDKLIQFCQAVQSASPIDSHVTPEPWAMPGYENEVIMAAGTFISGSSIELSADAPLREPYNVYIQGGLTFEHGVYALKKILSRLI